MADTTTTMTPGGGAFAGPSVLEGGFSRLSWRSVIGGSFAAIGVWIILGTLGLAIGLTAVSPEDPNLRGVAIWLGIWSLVVPIIAQFVGTLVATRASVGVRRLTGALYGVVVWGLTTFAAAVFVIWLLGSVVGQTVRAATGVVGGMGDAIGSLGGIAGQGAQAGGVARSLGSFLGVDRADLVAGLNRRLAAQGKPPIQLQNVQTAIREAANVAVRQGRFSTDVLVSSLARHTALSRNDVRDLGQQIERQWSEIMGGVSGTLQAATEGARNAALQVVNTTGDVMWWSFGSLLLGLLASLGAGVLATRLRPRAAETIPVIRWEEAPSRA